MTTFKRHSFKNVIKNIEQGEVSNVAGGSVNVTTIFLEVCQFLVKFDIYLPCDPASPLLTKKNENIHIYKRTYE